MNKQEMSVMNNANELQSRVTEHKRTWGERCSLLEYVYICICIAYCNGNTKLCKQLQCLLLCTVKKFDKENEL